MKYPNTDYAIDLKFKKDLIQNQLAPKELYVAKYYIEIQNGSSHNRLKVIVIGIIKKQFLLKRPFID